MSIRKKLVLSYIAMIAIPALLLILTVLLAASVFMRDSGTDQADGGKTGVPFAAIRGLFDGRSEATSGLRFIAQHDPKLLADAVFLKETETELADVEAGLLVLSGSNNTVAYASAGLNADEVKKQLADEVKSGHGRGAGWGPPWQRERGSGGGSGGNNGQLSLNQIAFTQPDGQPGTVVIVLDMEPVARFFRRFFPTVLLTLIGTLILTNGLLTYFVSRSIIKPLYALKDAASHIREGNLEHRLQEQSLNRQDEIGQLSRSFEEMRGRLQASIGAQLQLEQSRKELLANISHDLKTPITGIQGCVECLRDGIADTVEKRSKYIDMIASKTSDMNRMIEELLLYSTLDIGKLPFNWERLDAAEYMRMTVDELCQDPRMAGVSLTYASSLEPGGADTHKPVWIRADREKLNRALLNIVGNSLKHMEHEPRELRFELHVLDNDSGSSAATAVPSVVAIRVTDNGTGIPAEALPHVFDQFYRAEQSRRTDAGSSGLGLAIVKQIIDEHGGTVEARSMINKGTTIEMRLPVTRIDTVDDDDSDDGDRLKGDQL
ncbi:signal transduction histidine kinase [Paenibacillus taihuensis]|uniref:histidine kinase n=1 Tax=Paenibacillus taihuensis TaxID=1156355 RepID=A0A3D9RUQ3_9BACL|nr:HAMP domain-containing sensor histidine kinase [Paenibacillus taihuensis]REE81481.1 signal transduction histidine kinase [Paenibacillus taihuensis]